MSDKNNKIYFTTSWDDGHKLDLRLSELLAKYGIAGTFYVAKNFQERMRDEDIIKVSQDHEIGAHTITHPNLLKISESEAEKEITESKKWLESLISEEIKMFCYPFGNYDERIKRIIGSFGFIGARTVRDWVIKEPEDFFEMGTTIQVYPHPLRPGVDIRAGVRPFFDNIGGMIKYKISPKALFSWQSLARGLFDYVYKNGGVFHLWGHSWEIEKYGMWPDMEKFLEYISHREDCIYLTNGDLLNRIKKQ
ncbi:MAG: polysaccharide deacetylase family protein [Candidatus Azambacteria bacterium]|nr:polysaccharide deacetylase family protein [Candidatus Azambacteria bacterium]